jgi:hypothetical protein
VFDDLAFKNEGLWGDEKALFMIFTARKAFVYSIETFKDSNFSDDSPESFLDFQIMMALYAEELGIIARAILGYGLDTSNLSWLDEAEDKHTEDVILRTLGKLDTLKIHIPEWV